MFRKYVLTKFLGIDFKKCNIRQQLNDCLNASTKGQSLSLSLLWDTNYFPEYMNL